MNNIKTMLIDAHKGVSAIAIKENRYFDDISQELIDVNDLNFIQIPSDVIYTEIISSFMICL